MLCTQLTHRALMSSFFGSKAGRATLFHAVLVGAVTILKSSTNALFLTFCPASWLAALYVCVAAVVTVVTVLLAGPLSRIAPVRLLRASTWILSGLTAGLAGCAFSQAPLALAALYVATELYATVLSVLFWSTLAGWFDSRTSRQTFSLVSAGGMAGGMLCGLSMRLLVGGLGAAGTALVASVLTLLALPLLRVEPHERPTAASRAAAASMQSGAQYLLRRPYPRYIALLAGTFAILAACVDFVFRVQAASQLGEAALAALFGDLNAVVGAAAIVYQLVLTRRVLARGGLFVFLSVVPAVLALVSLTAALTGAFALVVLMKGVEMAGSYSIQQAGMQLLYNPIPGEARAAVRAFVDGLVRKGGLAVSGVLLVILAESFPSAVSPWLVLGLAVGSLFLLRPMRHGYLSALEDKLRGSRAVVVVPTVEVGDRATRKVLTRLLESSDSGDVLTVLALLREDPRFDPEPHLERLLTHDDAKVRLAALGLVPQRPSPSLEFTLTNILSLGERRPRAAAVRAYARVLPDKAATVLSRYLHDPDPGVVAAVIAALHTHPSAGPAVMARFADLIGGLRQASPGVRREMAHLLGELPLRLAEEHLPPLCEDAEASVRELALASAAQQFKRGAENGLEEGAMLELVRAVRARLAERSDRDHARDALTQLGDLVVPRLRRNLDERKESLQVRIEIPRLLAQIGSAAAAEALLFSNIKDHASLRYRIAESLFRLHRRHPDVPIDVERARAACRRRLQSFTHYRALCHALAAAEPTVPADAAIRSAWRALRRATVDRLLQNLETALHVCGLFRGAERMDRVARQLALVERAALQGASAVELEAQRADAIEVLDVALGGDPLHDEMLRALDPPTAQADAPDGRPRWRDAVHTAAALRGSADPLIAALARRVLASAPEESDVGSAPSILLAASWESAVPSDPFISDPTDSEDLYLMDEKLVTRILALEKVDLFEGLSIDDVAAIAGIAEEKLAEPNEVLYREGDPGDYMGVVLHGRVHMVRGGRTFMTVGGGESIGQVSLLDRGPRPITAVVSSDPGGAELLRIDVDPFMDLVTDRPGLTRGVFAVLAKRLRTLIDLQSGTGRTAATTDRKPLHLDPSGITS